MSVGVQVVGEFGSDTGGRPTILDLLSDMVWNRH